jgi:hypothetical protein
MRVFMLPALRGRAPCVSCAPSNGVNWCGLLQVLAGDAVLSKLKDARCSMTARDRGRPIRAAIEAIVDVSAWHPGRVVGLGGGGSQLLELDLPTLQWEVVA